MNSRESGWRELRLKHVIRSNPRKAEVRGHPEDLPVSFVPMDALGEYGGLDLSQERPLGEISSGYTYFRDGDVVVAKITPCFENGKGALAQNLRSGIAFGTTELHVLRPRRGLDGRFLFYLTISDRFRKLGEGSMFGAGGQKRISEEFVEEYKTAIPPLKDQHAIVSFLDRETARIDTLIDKKRRLLDLLEEKRTALITRAVTRGLDPDVPMRDSGVEWIGEIPEHWEIRQARYLCARTRPIIYGIVLPGPDVPEGVPLIKGGDVDRGNLSPSKLKRTAYEIERNHVRSRVAPGDIVYSIRGSYGHAALVPHGLAGANITQDAARISPRTFVDETWLAAAITSAPLRAIAEAGALGATIKGVNIRDLRRFPIPTPPREEQVQIADFLRYAQGRIGRAGERIRKAISLLREYRSTLISAAVTGQIEISSESDAESELSRRQAREL